MVISANMVSDNYEDDEGAGSIHLTPLRIKLIQSSWKQFQQDSSMGF